MTMRDWGETLGVNPKTIKRRLREGRPPDEVFSTDRRVNPDKYGKYLKKYFNKIERESDMRETKEYKYGMRLRGFAPACQPMQGLIRREDDPSGRYCDILVYDRLLDGEEMSQYSLDLVKGE